MKSRLVRFQVHSIQETTKKKMFICPQKKTLYVLCVSAGNEPDQPDPNLTQILTLRANPTQLNLILDPEGPTWKWVGFKSGLLSIYIL